MARARKLAPKFNRHNYTNLLAGPSARSTPCRSWARVPSPRVGVVGDLGQVPPTANNHVVDVIEREGCEAVVPGLLDFFLPSMSNAELQGRDG